MGVPHAGKLVFVREEIKNEHVELTAELYTATRLDELEAAGQLELHEQVAGGQVAGEQIQPAVAAAGG